MRSMLCVAVAAVVLVPAASRAAVEWKGDVRARHESIDEAGKEQRDRERIRARIGGYGSVADNVKAGVRLSSGSDDPVSTNETLTKGFSHKGIQLDQAYIEAALLENALNLVFGKMNQPWVKPGASDLIFDNDVSPEGVSAKWQSHPEGNALFAQAGAFAIEERSADDDTMLYSGQAGVLANMGGAKLTIGGGTYVYENVKGFSPVYDPAKAFGNSVTKTVDPVTAEETLFYANDYTLFEGFAELATTVVQVPVALFGHYVVNDEASKDDTGYLVGASVGAAKEKGSYELSVDYRSLEKDAVLGVFADSDSFGGGTNGEGVRLSGKVALAKNTLFGATYFMDAKDPDGKDVDYNRLQIDLSVKF